MFQKLPSLVKVLFPMCRYILYIIWQQYVNDVKSPLPLMLLPSKIRYSSFWEYFGEDEALHFKMVWDTSSINLKGFSNGVHPILWSCLIPAANRPKWSFYEAGGDAWPWHWLLPIRLIPEGSKHPGQTELKSFPWRILKNEKKKPQQHQMDQT